MSNAVLAFCLGSALWSYAGWSAHPRELWDVPTFWPVWGVAVLIAGVLGLMPGSHPLRDTGLLFLPILGVLAVSTFVYGGSANLLPLGVIVVPVLSLPGLAFAWLARRLTASRR